MKPRRPAAVVLLVVVLTACGATGGSVPASAEEEPSIVASSVGDPSASAPASPSQSATAGEGAAPPDIAGTWRRVVQGETVLLTLEGTGYNIQRAGNLGSGQIEVDGDRIRFYASTLCDGEGVYTWTIEEDRLRLTEVEEDPCSGRTDVLLLGTFGRADS